LLEILRIKSFLALRCHLSEGVATTYMESR
jgi:hypothetical protein